MGNDGMMLSQGLCITFFLLHLCTQFCLFLPHTLPGDIQVGMMDKKGQLEVEIIRARGLVVKPGSKTLPGKSRRGSPVTAHHPRSGFGRLCFFMSCRKLCF